MITSGRRYGRLGAALGTVLLLAGLGVSPALAAGDVTPLAGGNLIANVPTYSGGNAQAKGGRGDSCSGSVSWVEVKLMHVQAGPLPDMTMKTEKRLSVTNATWTASNPSTAGAVYRTLTRSSTGASSQSSTSSAP
ncbi:hypothetical protein [Salana multivorans]